MAVRRIFVEKKKGVDIEAQGLFEDLRQSLGLKGLQNVRLLNRYDIAGLTLAQYDIAKDAVFYEPAVDIAYDETLNVPAGSRVFALEYLPGQYDQRADSAAQCVQLVCGGEKPLVRCARVYVLEGVISDSELTAVRHYLINPVDSREASMAKPATLELDMPAPQPVQILHGFAKLNETYLRQTHEHFSLAMKFEDLLFCQSFFKDTGRDPTLAEIRIIDTYWSDHCRHTTFLTAIDSVTFAHGAREYEKVYKDYLASRKKVYGKKEKDRPVTLMDLATIYAKEAKATGVLNDLDESEEINACSIKAKIKVDGKDEDYLVMFKNETHNHPTEIEPYGGAATCLGGAIRDPLSGRSYVYHAMRVTGSGDPRTTYERTLEGKLPQRKITTEAAHGFSAYGNQIGLATGLVDEVYHPGFVAKRMEIGAVVGAAPARNVVRERPAPGDVILLIGGRTGRDGCGGATGSSKAHDESSILNCGAEVQKGNPLTERKLQRLFRNSSFSRLVKRCNDFGAGGVSVAVGELASGLEIYLDKIPKKYEGLDGIELAISESQERMAVVVARDDMAKAEELCDNENLECTHIADVTDDGSMRMIWRGDVIADIPRSFLDTNGVSQHATISVPPPLGESGSATVGELRWIWQENLSDLNVCSQMGLKERFDGSIGAGSVLMPHGGRVQATPAQSMAAKIASTGVTNSCTLMSWGYDPWLSCHDPFVGAVYAITDSLCKLTASGGDSGKARLTLQEYFEKLGEDPVKWSRPFLALLGAWHAQRAFGTPAIGGKDSMSGTFRDVSVPPTLVSFALTVEDAQTIISPEFKSEGNTVVYLPLSKDRSGLPDFEKTKKAWAAVRSLIAEGKIVSAWAVGQGGVAAGITKMCFGNQFGFECTANLTYEEFFSPGYGSLILEVKGCAHPKGGANVKSGSNPLVKFGGQNIGMVTGQPYIKIGDDKITLDNCWKAWTKSLEGIFPSRAPKATGGPDMPIYNKRNESKPKAAIAKPNVLITVFPGTNCEYDSAAAFEKAGASVQTLVMRNLHSADIAESIAELKKAISSSQIIMIPGGFSAGDEPDGSGKFITAVFRHPAITDAVMDLLKNRDGLMLGVCNGFQALIKLGLVPYGDIRPMQQDSPTLTYNTIGRHVSRIVKTRVASTLSPWLMENECGDSYLVPVSHGEGRFIATEAEIAALFANGQVATQYVDRGGAPSLEYPHNPNGSMYAIEGITSPDGRVFGKMGHTERIGEYLYKNLPGDYDMGIFRSGVKYFK